MIDRVVAVALMVVSAPAVAVLVATGVVLGAWERLVGR